MFDRDDVIGLPPQQLRPRRTHSMPSKYMIPAADMGEYESPMRRRSAPEREKPPPGLFPLNELGEYGQIPKGPLPPPAPFKRRELKPKVYSSYSVDPKCEMHSQKLAKSARDYSVENTSRKVSTSSIGSRASVRSSMSPAPERRLRTVSASPSRAPSERSYNGGRNSRSPEPFPNTLRNYSRSGPPSTPQPPRNTSRNRDRRDSSFEENDGYQYEENRISNGIMKSSLSSTMNRYSSSSTSYTNGFTNGGSQFDSSSSGKNFSLDSLRKPKVVSWDSMGILGLSNKMWSDTKKRQESFMESTGHFLREESYNSYIM